MYYYLVGLNLFAFLLNTFLFIFTGSITSLFIALLSAAVMLAVIYALAPESSVHDE